MFVSVTMIPKTIEYPLDYSCSGPIEPAAIAVLVLYFKNKKL